MTKSKMKKLAMAMGVVLGGIGMAPSTQAMNLATDGLGQVLIFPYYTVQGGWATLFNITNTSDQIVAAKIRFHESLNSRDVFDFNIVMSPHDVWNGWVANNGNGPSFFTADTTCTTLSALPVNLATDGVPFVSPALGTDGTLAYTGGAADGGSTAVTRMNEGYVEVITMAVSPVPPATPPAAGSALLRGAVHVNGAAPTGCADLATAFLVWPGVGAGDPDFATLNLWFTGTTLNPLKGSYNLLKSSQGYTASGSPTTIANFSNNSNLLTTTIPPGVVPFDLSFFEPSLNSGNTGVVGTDQFDVAFPAVATGGVNAVSELLARTHVINQWSRITDASNAWVTATDWVVTFPTKSFYVDNWPTSNFSARAAARAVVTPTTIPVAIPAYANTPTPFAQRFNDNDPSLATPLRRGESCTTTLPAIYNREELPKLGAGISPGAGNQLCYEANVLTFGVPGTTGTNILNSATARGVTPLPGANGYMDLPFTAVSTTNIPQGLPVIGFMVTTRDTGNGVLNEAFLIDHAYSRTAPPANP